MNHVAANAMYGNPAASQNGYGPFLPRPSRMFTDGAFGPMSPIQPVPVDEPPPGGEFPDPRWWQYRVGWNLPTLPGTEGLKLASFDQLYTLASKYSVARACIELRKEEIRGLDWEIQLTPKAAKAYQGDHKAMRDFGERAALATRFFKHPDPDFWNFGSFLDALLEEIFVYDALALVFRPKYGRGLGRGLLGSDLDSIRLVSGPTIRPLLDIHGGKPRPPAPSYQQFLYGVPRSDYQTIITGSDIDDYGLAGSEVNTFRADTMLYAPLVARRETPYGFPPVERALLPIISGLQKQEFQLDYFTEGTVPACYISPGDPNMTPTQIRELQDALNGIAGDPAYHLKVIVLPPGSKVDPQRNVDLSDSFDLLIQLQVAMAFDVQPVEVDILPNVGGSIGSGSGVGASAARFAAAEARDIKSRKSTKPLLMYLCDIFNYALQDICGQQDMQFAFEGLTDDEDKADITELGVQQVQNGIASIDEVRERLDLAPWGLSETSEPVVFTAQGPIPFSMAPQLIAAAQGGTPAGGGSQGTNSGQKTPSSRTRNSQPAVRQGGTTKPNGTHPKPLAPHRESVTPAHSAAAGAIQSPTPRTGGTPSRSQVAGSRKRGEAATRRASSHKAVESELDALRRHLRKGRAISTWVAEHIPERALGMIAEDIAKGVLIDTAVERASDVCAAAEARASIEAGEPLIPWEQVKAQAAEPYPSAAAEVAKAARWPGWERDLGLVGAYKNLIGQAFHDAETRGSELRKKAATGAMFVSNPVLRDLISDEVRDVFSGVLTPLWTEAWHLGYAAAKSLVTGEPADFAAKDDSEALRGFIGSEQDHWLQQISRTGLGNNTARSESIAWTEVGRAINTAAIQCYRDHGVTHKHLMLSPNACDICKDAADDGDIALDAPFSAGGVIGQVHVRCRCAPGPSGVEAEPPLAHLGKAQGYSLNPRSGMISLDVPEGTINPVPGGVTDHHITVVYLGPDVDDDAFATACQRAAIAAAEMPGPLAGAISGTGTFPPSDSSDGKVPAWGGVMLPGSDRLREALEDLSASEHKDWKPHVTLAYVEPGEPLPDPVPHTPVTFTHLSVHRGHDEVVRFPFGAAAKSAAAEDESRAAFLMLRSRHPEDGKPRYLLQLRPDGKWGLPGGTAHIGEPQHAAAVREATEEIGALPPLGAPAAVMVYDDDGRTVHVHLHDVPFFHPDGNGSTPEETAGTGWFRRGEVADLPLHGPFRRQWETADWKHLGKALQRVVDENGEVLTLTEPAQRLQATGARWPYPRRSDGTEWPDAGPGAVPSELGSAGAEPPGHFISDGAQAEPHGDVAPRGGQDGTMPSRGRKPNPGPAVFPEQGEQDMDAWPYPQTTLTPAASPVGADTGVPPSGEKRAKVSKESVHYHQAAGKARCGNCVMFHPSQSASAIQLAGACDLVRGEIYAKDVCDRWEPEGAEKNDSGHPVVGSVAAQTPKPYAPHSVEPEVFDPAEAVETWSPEGDTDVVHTLPRAKKGASDLRDPNPVEAEHVYSQLLENYPPDSIAWVKAKGIHWVGPVLIPTDRVDVDDEESWAASHQGAAVRRFARGIDNGTGHTHPVVMVQPSDNHKAIVIDGHHRFLAYRKLGRPVKAYVGYVDKVTPDMLETHTRQQHQGSDPANKLLE
jgi:8-oxo-dGTP pyrophosphatase MutT (NUDIX family)